MNRHRFLVLVLLVGVLVPGTSPSATAAPACRGKWVTQQLPPLGGGYDILWDVEAIAPSDVWAVGEYTYAGTGRTMYTLILHWDGSTWQQYPPLSVGSGVDARLISVTALAPDDVWVVGSRFPFGHARALSAHWDGSAWTIVPTPNPGLTDNQLNDVSFSSPTDGWAVGEADFRTLAMHWDGSSWAVVPTPTQGQGELIPSVATLGPTDAWALAPNYGEGFEDRVLHWDGAEWSIQATGVAGGSLEAASPDYIWAAGSRVWRWNGSVWTEIETAIPTDAFFSISAPSETSAWGVGARSRTYGSVTATHTLAEHWNGTSWRVEGTPNPSRSFSVLYSVSALSNQLAWAVGQYRPYQRESRAFILVHC